MSIIVKGMDMPTACMKDCPFQYFGDCYGGKIKRIMDVEAYEDKRHPRCPLIEIPTPHGDLIDAEVIFENIMNNITLTNGIPKAFKDTPTLIESEEVYNQYIDTGGNYHWTGVNSGIHHL